MFAAGVIRYRAIAKPPDLLSFLLLRAVHRTVTSLVILAFVALAGNDNFYRFSNTTSTINPAEAGSISVLENH